MFREAGLGPCQFRPRVVDGDAAGHIDEGNPGSDAQPSPGQCNLGCNLHPDSAAFTRTGQQLSRPVEDCAECPALAGVRDLGLDDPSPDRPVLHCNFGGALSAPSVDTGFSCVADSDLSGQVRRFASDESAASSRQSVGCGCLLGPVATAVNRLYRNSASSMYQRVLVVVSNSISDREHVMRSPTPSLPATSGPTTLAARTPE